MRLGRKKQKAEQERAAIFGSDGLTDLLAATHARKLPESLVAHNDPARRAKRNPRSGLLLNAAGLYGWRMKATPPLRVRLHLGVLIIEVLSALVLAPPALAQAPWIVTVTPTMNPLPVGFCAPVQVIVRDAAGADTPRNPQGYRVTLADFDLSVTSPNPALVVGQQVDASHWSVCACQGAAPGSDATITASYPARALPEAARVKGVSVRSTAGLALAAAKGTTNPPACNAPAGASLPAPVAIGTMPAAPPMTITPAVAPTRSDPMAQVKPKGEIGERVVPYQPGVVTATFDVSANGWWYEPRPITVDIDVDGHGLWYAPAPVTVDVDMSATGNWLELAKSPIAPRAPARQ